MDGLPLIDAHSDSSTESGADAPVNLVLICMNALGVLDPDRGQAPLQLAPPAMRKGQWGTEDVAVRARIARQTGHHFRTHPTVTPLTVGPLDVPEYNWLGDSFDHIRFGVTGPEAAREPALLLGDDSYPLRPIVYVAHWRADGSEPPTVMCLPVNSQPEVSGSPREAREKPVAKIGIDSANRTIGHDRLLSCGEVAKVRGRVAEIASPVIHEPERSPIGSTATEVAYLDYLGTGCCSEYRGMGCADYLSA